MKTTPKKRLNTLNNKVIKKKNNNKKIWLLAGIIIIVLISIFIINRDQNPKETLIVSNDISTEESPALNISNEALKRAKEMLAVLPASDDPYGIKEIFTTTEIIPTSVKGNSFDLKLQPGKEYCIVFFLPENEEDYKKTGGFLDAIMYTATSSSPELPVFGVINPKAICDYKNNEVSLDYAASMFLHEVVHIYQRSACLRNGQSVSNDIEDIKRREKEAYYFQSKFINQILSRNNIDKKVIVPVIDIKKINYEGLQNLCQKVDEMNNYKLGPLSSLIVFQKYPDIYVSIANSKYSGEDLSFH